MVHEALRSIAGVCEVSLVRGARAGDRPDLLLETPHGATRAVHFDALRAALRGPLPDDLRDFFFVNTDVGSPELAQRVAELLVAASPQRSVLLIRSLIPRTFVDCNRIVDTDAAPGVSAPGEVTPGLHAYVRDPSDRALLLERYAAYRRVVEAAYRQVCGEGPGLALMVHTYAPRSLDIPVDDRIVERLRSEYAPDRIGRWPMRPEVDLIADDEDGRRLASDALTAHCEHALRAAGFAVANGATYHLHPATMAHQLALRHPDRTLCVEFRRDLLVPEFTPFAEMLPDPERVERAAAALAAGLAAAFPAP
jgi:hypothetical protein